MVITLPAQCADTPAGKLLAPDTPSLEIPVAPVVAIVILVSAVLIQRVGVEEGAPAVLFGVTVTTVAAEGALWHPDALVTCTV